MYSESAKITVHRGSAGLGVVSAYNARLTLIDLHEMTEDADFFVNTSTTYTTFPTSFESEDSGVVSLTFTPDGVSNYFVIAGAHLVDGGSLRDCAVRVKDITR